MEYLTVVLGRISPLGIEIDAVVVRIPSHVIPVRKGCHRQWRRHRHARSLVSDIFGWFVHQKSCHCVVVEKRNSLIDHTFKILATVLNPKPLFLSREKATVFVKRKRNGRIDPTFKTLAITMMYPPGRDR